MMNRFATVLRTTSNVKLEWMCLNDAMTVMLQERLLTKTVTWLYFDRAGPSQEQRKWHTIRWKTIKKVEGIKNAWGASEEKRKISRREIHSNCKSHLFESKRLPWSVKAYFLHFESVKLKLRLEFWTFNCLFTNNKEQRMILVSLKTVWLLLQ